eukprot:TRINITY_DN20789_c0_g1::TRINITY_DN20789_c0_g1_i1::g.10717::m.10717 TRINITY_DN20789_c0_g1::TRINITY_DN20789_c0_g1_i1::g.10717  ORF type:complete len:225 (-),score=33.99,sp/Q84WU9/C3H64_ARATH/35.59/2e-37,CwfJ_C_1/PF04677.10/2.2e-28,CwfJ_C_2/PF04676.9/4.6e-15 TRINITY_DN20789_c0_g1_i1:203-805(-)
MAETHLVAHIGTEAYVALPKGGIVSDHVLILPVEHFPSTDKFPPSVQKEIDQLIQSVLAMYRSQKQVGVVLDRNVNVKGHQHAHLQVVPVPEALKDQVESVLLEEGQARRMTFRLKPEGLTIQEFVEGSEYFAVTLPDGRIYVQKVGQERHSLQFGRELMAKVLGKPERANWKECQLPKNAEEMLANSFKMRFGPFAPSD